jgi:anti-anti-sigma factor
MSFSANLTINDDVATIDLSGELDGSVANEFKEKVEEVASTQVKVLVLNMADLEYMSSAGLRVLVFAKQKMGTDVEVDVVSPQEMVLDTIKKAGLQHSFKIIE